MGWEVGTCVQAQHLAGQLCCAGHRTLGFWFLSPGAGQDPGGHRRKLDKGTSPTHCRREEPLLLSASVPYL